MFIFIVVAVFAATAAADVVVIVTRATNAKLQWIKNVLRPSNNISLLSSCVMGDEDKICT